MAVTITLLTFDKYGKVEVRGEDPPSVWDSHKYRFTDSTPSIPMLKIGVFK